MTHQTNEELRDQLDRKFNKYFEHYEDVEQSHIDKMVNEILSLIPQPEQSWEFCPNCGSKEIHHQEFKADGELHRQCKRCHQEYFSKVDYLESMRLTLEKLYLKSIAQPVNIVSGIDYKGEIVRCEPLLVTIVDRHLIDARPNCWVVTYKYSDMAHFHTQLEAIEFCKRHGFKIWNEVRNEADEKYSVLHDQNDR